MKTEYYDLNGTSLSIPIPESYKDCFTLIKSDRYRYTGKIETSLSIVINALKPFSRPILFWLRLSSYKGVLYPFCRFIYEIVRRKNHIQINPKVKIGYGLYIGHGICMVINPNAIIGNNVNLSQFLNIGSNHGTAAIIGDNVYIGPHVCLVENVKIGNNSTIGAGAVVTKDIPENATAVGVPAKVLNYDNPGSLVGCRYKF